MRRIGLLPVLLLGVTAAAAAAADGDAITGKWRTSPAFGRVATIEIVRAGDEYEGKILVVDPPTYREDDPKGMGGQPLIDRENPDPTLRKRPLPGIRLLYGFRYEDGEWSGGRIYDPETGKTYRCRLRMGEDGSLRVRGYVGLPIFGRTTRWTRPPEGPRP